MQTILVLEYDEMTSPVSEHLGVVEPASQLFSVVSVREKVAA